MCVVKTPKIANDGSVDKTKPLPILRNPLLDGIDSSIRSLQLGRSALRIDRVTDAVAGPAPAISGATGGSAGFSGGSVSGGGGGGLSSSPRISSVSIGAGASRGVQSQVSALGAF